MKTQPFLKDLQQFLTSNARYGESHSETDHLEYRISVPSMRNFVAQWLASHESIALEDWLLLLDALYHGESLEERQIAGMLLERHKAHRQALSLERLKQWLEQLHGWKEVDGTCQTVFTPQEIFKRWQDWETFLRDLAHADNINLQRASLVLLVDVVRSSADVRGITLALELVQHLHTESDKRISKAVSWILREAVKLHRSAIQAYLDLHRTKLPNATVKELESKLNTGKKR
jgi:3-methyladenine DNA glycosylase AlkD